MSGPFRIDDYTLEPTGEAGRWRLGLSEAWVESVAGEGGGGAASPGEFVALELQPPGTRLHAGEALGFIHTPRRTYDLRVPFALEVLALNAAALANPALVRLAPGGRGWLAEVRKLK